MGYRYTDVLKGSAPAQQQKRTNNRNRAVPVKKIPAAPVKKASSPRLNQLPLTPPASPVIRSAAPPRRSPTPTSLSASSRTAAKPVVTNTVPNAITVDGTFQSRLLPCPAMLQPHMRKPASTTRSAVVKSASANTNVAKNKAADGLSIDHTVKKSTTDTVTTTGTTPLVKAASERTDTIEPTDHTHTSSSKRGSSKKSSGSTKSKSSTPEGSGTKRKTRGESPKKSSTPRKRGPDDGSDDSDSDNPSDPPSKKPRYTKRRPAQPLPIIENTFELKFVIKGHTEDNIPVRFRGELEDSKDNWCCAFEPRIKQSVNENGGAVMDVVAICGSYTVLFLDTQQGRYIKKYTHPESQEIFYCLAWTTLTGKEQLLLTEEGGIKEAAEKKADNEPEDREAFYDESSCNLLAVAGRLGSIKLLNPLQNECYRYLFGHQKAVLALTFAKAEPRWLLSASADRTVRLWDIGSPRNNEDDSSCLALFELPTKNCGIPTSVDISFDLSTVIVGCDNGDMYRFQITAKELKAFRERAHEHRTEQPEDGNKWYNIGPLATIKPKLRYPAGDEWHAGYVDDVHILGQDGDSRHKMNSLIVSRAAEDMEIIVWDPKNSTGKDGDIHMSLEWPHAEGSSGLKFRVIEQDGQKVIVSGDYDGGIRIYNIGHGKRSKTLSDNSLEQMEPVKVLFHSMSSELMRDVACSSDTRTIVAIDNNNTIFVWGSK